MKDLITGLVTKFYEAIIITLMVFLFLALCWGCFESWQSNHYKAKYQNSSAENAKQITSVHNAYQKAIDAWRATVFMVENELEAERNNIKIEFRDIKHETQKVITNTIYSNCKLDNAGMSIAERARIAANTRKPP